MTNRSFTSEGFVLARRNYGESDRIIAVYSKDKGKISLLAKGVRKPSSRKRGHIEIFTKINFQAVNTKGIGIITEAETINDYKLIRKSIRKVSLAYYMMEVMGKITHEDDPNPGAYELLDRSMKKLIKTKRLKDLRISFISDLLKVLGFWPKDKKLALPDSKLEEILEREIHSQRVGKIITS